MARGVFRRLIERDDGSITIEGINGVVATNPPPRCRARHPMHTIRCEEPKGHDGDHFHSFYMRHWSDG